MAMHKPTPITQTVRDFLQVPLTNYCVRTFSSRYKDGSYRLKFYGITRGVPVNAVLDHLRREGWRIISQFTDSGEKCVRHSSFTIRATKQGDK